MFVFAILETFIILSALINSLLLSASFRSMLFLCLRLLIAKCCFAVDKVVIKDSYLLVA